MTSNNRNFFFHGYGGQKSDIKVSWKFVQERLSLPLPTFDGSRHSLSCGHITPIPVSVVPLHSSLLCVFSYFISNIPLCPSLGLGSFWVIQDALLISTSLTYSHLQRLFSLVKLIFTGSRNLTRISFFSCPHMSIWIKVRTYTQGNLFLVLDKEWGIGSVKYNHSS